MALRVSSKSIWAGQGKKNPTSKGVGRYPVVEKSARTMDGVTFDSKTEMQRYAHLKMGVRANLVRNLKLQVSFAVKINGQPYCVYTADFTYEELVGTEWHPVVEEVKSAGTIREKDYSLRRKAAELYHGFTVREIVSR